MKRQHSGSRRTSNKRKKNDTKLIGWLVSYSIDPKGFAFELRTGRTLISSKHGNFTYTLAVNNGSVSAPHAAINAEDYCEVMMQDIFSDNGSFLQKNGSDEETAISGPIELEHGDWIRVGNNSKFQVCLLEVN